MITRDLIKDEIDRVQERYLETLYRMIKALTSPPDQTTQQLDEPISDESWRAFIQSTYGSFAEDPIERGEQGPLEVRESLE